MVMEQYLINDTSLEAIGDAIRAKKGEEKYLPEYFINETIELPEGTEYVDEYEIDKPDFLDKLTVGDTLTVSCENYDYSSILFYSMYGGAAYSIYLTNNVPHNITSNELYRIQQPEVTFKLMAVGTGHFYNGSKLILTTSLVSDDPDPATNYLPSEMGDEIDALKDGPTDEDLTFTGSLQYFDWYGRLDWLLEKYGDDITFNNIDNMGQCFMSSNLKDMSSFVFHFSADASFVDISSMFGSCYNLEQLPVIGNTLKVFQVSRLFSSCNRLRTIPDNWANNIDWSYTHSRNATLSSVFENCVSLRHIPSNLIENIYCPSTSTSTSYYPYGSQYASCYVLDTLNNIPVISNNNTSNLFSATFSNCSRLKLITFKTENNQPIIATWKNQIIDLSEYVGYVQVAASILNYNSGLTTATQITDATSYELLKNNPDSWTADINYSRYNHDSAVETINSLPDTSAYGTNTIKFKGAAGALTDGGAINTLTTEEIAVATEKGWTVSLV